MIETTVLILGVGNLLKADDGVGVHVVRELQQRRLPESVEVVDGGTSGAELIVFLEGKRKVIIVDAMRADAPAGSIFRVPLESLSPRYSHPLSTHDLGLAELLYRCQDLHPRPEIIVYGIVPENTERIGTELSETVQTRIPTILTLLLKEATGQGNVVPT